MAVQKMSKRQIDQDVLRLLLLDEVIKKLQKEAKGIKNNLEAQYHEDDAVREIISGITCEYEKIPINKGAHNYDPAKVQTYTDACGKTAEVIETVPVVDTKKFEALAAAGFFPATVLDKCRINNWTFKSTFRRKEEETQGANVSQAAVNNAFNKVLGEINTIKIPKKATRQKVAQ